MTKVDGMIGGLAKCPGSDPLLFCLLGQHSVPCYQPNDYLRQNSAVDCNASQRSP